MDLDIVEFIKTLAALIGAAGVIVAAVVGAVNWFNRQNKQSTDIENLREQHQTDIAAIKDELCVLSYAMLAALDGLMQLHCNGNVAKAHEALEKHINKQAHDQRKG